MATLAARLGAPVLAPPRSSSNHLDFTHVYGDGDVGYVLTLDGVKGPVNILGSTLSVSSLKTAAAGVRMTKTSVRGNPAVDEQLAAGNVLIWREDGRTWRAIFPDSAASPATVEHDLRSFVAYAA
jgi:hypothetical protein